MPFRIIISMVATLGLSCLISGCVLLSHLGDAELVNPEVRHDPIPFQLFGYATGPILSYRLGIPCSLSGHGERCIFDTGARHLLVYSCNEHLPVQGRTRSRGAALKSVRQERVTIDSVKIDKRIYRDVVATRIGSKSCQEAAGLVGIDIFREELCLDFASMTLAASGCEDIPLVDTFSFQRKKILIASRVGDKSVLSVFDTGAARSFLDTHLGPDLMRHGVKIPRSDSLRAADVNGTPFAIGAFYRAKIDVFGMGEETVHISTTDLQPVRNLMRHPIDFVVGLDIIQKYRWRFDFRSLRWGARAL